MTAAYGTGSTVQWYGPQEPRRVHVIGIQGRTRMGGITEFRSVCRCGRWTGDWKATDLEAARQGRDGHLRPVRRQPPIAENYPRKD